MKTSYKLYGTFWDNRGISGKIKKIQCIGEQTSTENTLIFTEILANEQPEDHSGLVGESVALLLDYMPENESTIVWEFYLKRLLQIVEYYNVETIICKEQQRVVQLEDAIENYYKKKTPNRLLAQSNGVL